MMNSHTIALQQPLYLSVFAALVAVVLWPGAPLLVDIASAVPPFRLATIALFSGAVAALPMALCKHKKAGIKTALVALELKWKLVIYGLVPALIFGAVAIARLMPLLFVIAGAGAATADSLSGSAPGMPSGGALIAGIALGLGPYGLAMVAWDLALRTGPTALIGSLAYAVPVLAAVLLVVAGIAAPDWRLPVAAVLVVGSVLASLKSGQHRTTQPAG